MTWLPVFISTRVLRQATKPHQRQHTADEHQRERARGEEDCAFLFLIRRDQFLDPDFCKSLAMLLHLRRDNIRHR